MKDFLGSIIAFLSLKNTLVFTCVGLVLGGLFVYYQYNERTFEKLISTQVQLLKKVDEQTVLIETSTENHRQIVDAMIKYNKIKDDATKRIISLKGSFDRRSKKTFEEITKRKSTLIEKKINDATQNYFDSISSIINRVPSENGGASVSVKP